MGGRRRLKRELELPMKDEYSRFIRELLLSRQRAEEVRKFFQATDASLLAITEFSLYSLGVILRIKRQISKQLLQKLKK